MSRKVTNEESKSKLGSKGEAVKVENKEAEAISGDSKAVATETDGASPKDSLQAVGHVPLPGTGGGKGSTDKKKKI